MSAHVVNADRFAVAQPAPSSSNAPIATTLLSSLLAVPQHRPSRRLSLESAFSGSDISELSFDATGVQQASGVGLLGRLRNVSSTLGHHHHPQTWRAKVHEFWIANYGAFLVLVSQMFGCTMNIATRMLETPGTHGEPMHPFQILFVRQSVTVAITAVYATYSKAVPDFPLGPRGKVRLLLVARGLFGFLGVFGLYFSLLFLPLSEATVLTFLAPIGTCYAFSLLIPGETFSRQQQLAGFISFLGVIFIARPASLFQHHASEDQDVLKTGSGVGVPANSTTLTSETAPEPTSAQHIQAVGIAMLGVVGAIGAMTSIRAIGNRVHALISVNYFSTWCCFVSLVALVVFPSVSFRFPSNVLEWGLLSVLGCAGFVMQLLLTKGMAYGASSNVEPPATRRNDLEMQTRGSGPQRTATTPNEGTGAQVRKIETAIKGSGAKATSMFYTQMLFALVSDKIVFGITPGAWSWVGSVLILFGAIWVATDGGKRSKDASNESSNIRVTSDGVQGVKFQGAQRLEEEVGLLANEEADLGHDKAPPILSEVLNSNQRDTPL